MAVLAAGQGRAAAQVTLANAGFTLVAEAGVNPKDAEYYFGLLNRDLSPKPSLLAYCTIAEALDQAKFLRALKFADPKAKGLLFDTPRGPMAILWHRADGYVLSKKPVLERSEGSDKYAAPEPWVDEWKTKVTLQLPANGLQVRVLDCIGQETLVTARQGKAQLTLDGAPRIVYGLKGDVLADITRLEDRSRFIAVMQGGIIKAGRLAGQVSANSASATGSGQRAAGSGQPNGSHDIDAEVAEQIIAEHRVGEVPA